MGVKPGRVSDMVFISTKPKQFTVADGVRSKRCAGGAARPKCPQSQRDAPPPPPLPVDGYRLEPTT
ncbi:DUF724 domain containing protein 3, partial [Dissostichus eleginoides]